MITTPISPTGRTVSSLGADVATRFGSVITLSEGPGEDTLVVVKRASALPTLCKYLFWEAGCSFGGIVAEEQKDQWNLLYLFLLPGAGWIHLRLAFPVETRTLPSISAEVHAADWYEREAEDLFGLRFEGHPRLGDFILHDQVWQEDLAPMRLAFDPRQPRLERRPNQEWRPTLVVKDPGAFAMPVGPIYDGGLGESIHFLLETVGEDVIRAVPRLFYNYRAVEKLAEGKTVSSGILLAERFAAKSAFAHSLAYCQAVERAARINVPARATRLRVILCELERLRHHAGAIEGICQSTALSVSEAQAAIIEEELLRASCVFTGHRYLFGLNTPGGLRRDFDAESCSACLAAVNRAVEQLCRLEDRLRYTSSFLDRLEDVGVITPEAALDLDLVGPIGRASGLAKDLRAICPYASYQRFRFEVPCEMEGDGYARLRILFAETKQSASLIRQAIESLRPGEICAEAIDSVTGSALGWVEAPLGTALHYVKFGEGGRIDRYRILPPSFRNWLGLHVAVEDFAFQDFPIILATFGLSATECDR